MTNEQRLSALAYLGFFGSLMLMGLLAWLFEGQTSTTLTAADQVQAQVLGTVETAPASSPAPTAAPTTAPAPVASTSTTSVPETTTTTTTTTTIPLADRQLARVDTVFGDIAPKSVTSTGTGLFFAQNLSLIHI